MREWRHEPLGGTVILELRRTGGITGEAKRWRVDAGDDASWRALVDAADLRFRGPLGRILGLAFLWVPGAAHADLAFDLWVDGRRATFRGVDVEGSLHDLVDRIMREGDSPAAR